MHICKKVLSFTLNFFIVVTSVLLFFNIFFDIQTTLLNRSYKSFFGYSIFEIQTGSMEDTIYMGDWILIKNTKDVDLNDIVTFEENGNFITHRVIQKYGDYYITKGDANNREDNPILQEQVVGKVVKVLPRLGLIRAVLLNVKVLIPAILTLIIACSLFDDSSYSFIPIFFKKLFGFKKKAMNTNDGVIATKVIDEKIEDDLSMTSILSRIDICELSDKDTKEEEKYIDDEII